MRSTFGQPRQTIAMPNNIIFTLAVGGIGALVSVSYTNPNGYSVLAVWLAWLALALFGLHFAWCLGGHSALTTPKGKEAFDFIGRAVASIRWLIGVFVCLYALSFLGRLSPAPDLPAKALTPTIAPVQANP